MMAVVRVEVCEICRDVNKPVKHYRVGDPHRTVKVALCAQHAAPIDELISAHSPGVRSTPENPVTMDVVEAARKAGRRPRGPRVKAR